MATDETDSVTNGRAALDEKGLRELRATRSSGRLSKLSEAEQKALRQILKRGARSAGYPIVLPDSEDCLNINIMM